MKLTPHEKKVLSLVESNPEIIDNSKKREEIAKINGLSEKTLRNRIGDLKKYGVISSIKYKIKNDSLKITDREERNQKDIIETFSLIKKEKKLIIKYSCFAGMIGLLYALTIVYAYLLLGEYYGCSKK